MTTEQKTNKAEFLKDQLRFFFPQGGESAKMMTLEEWLFKHDVWNELAGWAVADGFLTEAETDSIYRAHMA